MRQLDDPQSGFSRGMAALDEAVRQAQPTVRPWKAGSKKLQEHLESLSELTGAEALREKLRLLAPGVVSVVCRRQDVARVLARLDSLEIAASASGNAPAVGATANVTDKGQEAKIKGRVDQFLRLRPETYEGIKAFCSKRGLGINAACNELLAAALAGVKA